MVELKCHTRPTDIFALAGHGSHLTGAWHVSEIWARCCRNFRANVYSQIDFVRRGSSMDISFLVLGAALAIYGLGSLMDRNARKVARQRRRLRIPR